MILATLHLLSGMTSTFRQSIMAQDWLALFPTFLLRRECNYQKGDLREIL
uniref:Cha101 n=1 Tax=Arundo donax TaxID=35708 RepID=A0A0A9FK72_ARUDO